MSNYYAPLDIEALLHIEGPDSLKFLQGQTTCDTGRISSTQALPGVYCTVKGRVVCDFLLTEIGADHYVLRMRRDILASSAATLAKYIIFSKATLDCHREDWQTFACWGSEASGALTKLLGQAPKAQHCAVSGEGYAVVQMDEPGTQFECYINGETQTQLVAELALYFSASDAQNWQALQIEQGIARIEAATAEEFIPQMLNYDLNGFISFDKGCYTGQEVVARMHYRGTPKRRLYHATLPVGETAKAGELLYAAGSEQSAGTVVNHVAPQDKSCALVVATVAAAEQGFHLRSPTGPVIVCSAVNEEELSNVSP